MFKSSPHLSYYYYVHGMPLPHKFTIFCYVFLVWHTMNLIVLYFRKTCQDWSIFSLTFTWRTGGHYPHYLNAHFLWFCRIYLIKVWATKTLRNNKSCHCTRRQQFAGPKLNKRSLKNVLQGSAVLPNKSLTFFKGTTEHCRRRLTKEL